MNDREQDIFSKALRAGRRTYFFDVKSTKAGDYYLTITESKNSLMRMGHFISKNTKFISTKKILMNLNRFLKKRQTSSSVKKERL